MREDSTRRLWETGTAKVAVLSIVAVLTCFLPAAWVFVGNGSESRRWRRLLPFCIFRSCGGLGRARLVSLLAFGTLVGLCGEFCIPIPPM
jgi:hypothetical protein